MWLGSEIPMHLCTSVSEEGGDGEDAVSETPSLLSYTLRYVSLVELGTLYRVGFRDPMYLCTSVSEEGGDGESVVSEGPSLLSYTLRYVSLTDLGRLCQFGLTNPTVIVIQQWSKQSFQPHHPGVSETPVSNYFFKKNYWENVNLIVKQSDHSLTS